MKTPETDVCDLIVEIPTDKNSPSLNVAAAILIACHELRMETQGPAIKGDKHRPADKEDVQALLLHIDDVIRDECPPKPKGLKDKMLRRLTMLLHRASPDAADVRMLRGLLSSVGKKKAKTGSK